MCWVLGACLALSGAVLLFVAGCWKLYWLLLVLLLLYAGCLLRLFKLQLGFLLYL
jgi:hypothetical protein